MVLSSIPKNAIVSIQPDPYGPAEFMSREEAEKMLNAIHVGGMNVMLANVCTSSPGYCKSAYRGGLTIRRSLRRRSLKRLQRTKSRKNRKS